MFVFEHVYDVKAGAFHTVPLLHLDGSIWRLVFTFGSRVATPTGTLRKLWLPATFTFKRDGVPLVQVQDAGIELLGGVDEELELPFATGLDVTAVTYIEADFDAPAGIPAGDATLEVRTWWTPALLPA